MDGYLAAISSAIVACNSIIKKFCDLPFIPFPQDTITGGLAKYVSTISKGPFFPMIASYTLFSRSFHSDDEAFDYSCEMLDAWKGT